MQVQDLVVNVNGAEIFKDFPFGGVSLTGKTDWPVTHHHCAVKNCSKSVPERASELSFVLCESRTCKFIFPFVIFILICARAKPCDVQCAKFV